MDVNFSAMKGLGRPHNPEDVVKRILQLSMHTAVVVNIVMFIMYIKTKNIVICSFH